MLFHKKSLENKLNYLDLALYKPAIIEEVVRKNVPNFARLVPMPRVWEPGGGSTLFKVETFGNGEYLLKVKSKYCEVESQLESERSPISKSSLKNEYDFIEEIKVSKCSYFPRALFFEEADELHFLAIEWLTPFVSEWKNKSVEVLLKNSADIEAAIKELFDRGIVHTDIHEHNLCYRGDQIVIVDFEEARFLKQEVEFSKSLDVAGENQYGNVGDFPKIEGGVQGLTCFSRLDRVLKNCIKQSLIDNIEKYNFDNNCDFNLDQLQNEDKRIYQSLNFDGLVISGQRPQNDRRLSIIHAVFKQIAKRVPIYHLDIGSNLGIFCFNISKYNNVNSSIGIEAFKEYVWVARALKHIFNYKKISFHNIVCGDESLELISEKFNVVTMFSVYHHVANKKSFLRDLANKKIEYLLAEFATQDRFYPERGNLKDEIEYIKSELRFSNLQHISTSADYGRPIYLFSNSPIDETKLTPVKILNGFYHGANYGFNFLKRAVRYLKKKYKLINFHLKKSIKNDASSVVRSINWVKNNSIKNEGIVVSSRKRVSYPEVTGYMIPTLLSWGQKDLAIQYSNWLVSIQNEDGSWTDSSGKVSYTFDSGQILKGLISILPYNSHVEKSLLKGCTWLAAQIREDGSISTPDKSSWGLPGNKVVSENIHLYCLEVLKQVGHSYGMQNYLDLVKKSLNHYLNKPNLTEFNTLSHFHAYVLEALVDLGEEEIARVAMKKIEGYQKSNGSIPAYNDVDWICSTAVAQYAVIWFKLGDLGPARRAIKYLMGIQNNSGGFYGSYGLNSNYFRKQEISWANKYFLDAYYLYIKTAFNEETYLFPDAIGSNDGRLNALNDLIKGLNCEFVLDAGCGRGRFLRRIRDLYPSLSLYGIDISDRMLQEPIQGVELKQSSLLNIDYPDETFDFIYTIETLEHCVDIKTAINEMYRTLKKGGTLLVIDKNIELFGLINIAAWEQWFDKNELTKNLKTIFASVSSEYISSPDLTKKLFIKWICTK